MHPDELASLIQASVRASSKAERTTAAAHAASRQAASDIALSDHKMANLKVTNDELNAKDTMLNERQKALDGLLASTKKNDAKSAVLLKEQESKTAAINSLIDRFKRDVA